ncbi:hypothetical protein BDQ17DRAFT_1332580 [Cyathus striatus]|nr:hypothetical protein BDQ17DRAFT_1332580 [Cyathus striatus]
MAEQGSGDHINSRKSFKSHYPITTIRTLKHNTNMKGVFIHPIIILFIRHWERRTMGWEYRVLFSHRSIPPAHPSTSQWYPQAADHFSFALHTRMYFALWISFCWLEGGKAMGYTYGCLSENYPSRWSFQRTTVGESNTPGLTLSGALEDS